MITDIPSKFDARPPGLVYIPNFISEGEEKSLSEFVDTQLQVEFTDEPGRKSNLD